MRTLGCGLLAVGKALLAQVAVIGFCLALGLVLSLVFGVTGRFDRWVRTHNISPSLLVAIAVFANRPPSCSAAAWRSASSARATTRTL
jgi:hypothetical protein